MVLKNLGKSIYFNFADPYYKVANWESRGKFIIFLRSISKQVGRAIDLLGGDLLEFDQEKIDELNGIKIAVEYAADQFEVYKNPIEEVRIIIQDRALQYEIILTSYKQKIGYEPDFKYYGAAFNTLIKILEQSEGLQEEEKIMQQEGVRDDI